MVGVLAHSTGSIYIELSDWLVTP